MMMKNQPKTYVNVRRIAAACRARRLFGRMAVGLLLPVMTVTILAPLASDVKYSQFDMMVISTVQLILTLSAVGICQIASADRQIAAIIELRDGECLTADLALDMLDLDLSCTSPRTSTVARLLQSVTVQTIAPMRLAFLRKLARALRTQDDQLAIAVLATLEHCSAVEALHDLGTYVGKLRASERADRDLLAAAESCLQRLTEMSNLESSAVNALVRAAAAPDTSGILLRPSRKMSTHDQHDELLLRSSLQSVMLVSEDERSLSSRDDR